MAWAGLGVEGGRVHIVDSLAAGATRIAYWEPAHLALLPQLTEHCSPLPHLGLHLQGLQAGKEL